MRPDRTRPRARRLALGIVVAVGLLIVADAVLRLGLGRAGESVPSTLQSFLMLATLTVLGALVAARRPRNPIGWLMLGSALVSSLAVFAKYLAARALLGGASIHGWVRWPAWFQNTMSAVTVSIVVMIFLLFPDGRLPFPLARWAAGSLIAVVGGLTVLSAIDPSPFVVSTNLPKVPNPIGLSAIRGFQTGSTAVGALWFLLAVPLVLAIASVVVRLRRSHGDERQQLTLVAYAVGVSLFVTLAGVVLSTFAQQAGTSESLGDALISLGTNAGLGLVVPGVVAMTILRHRMYDIDRLVNRTLVYTLLTAVLAAIYVGLVVGLGTVTRSVGGRSGRGVVVATSTLAVAALFRPVRRRAQAVIDRRFYRRRYDAARTIGAFASRLRTEADLESLRRDLLNVVSETMQPATVSVWLGLRRVPGPGIQPADDP